MEHRSGKKWGKSHTTLTEAAAKLGDLLVKDENVTKVIPRIITVSRGRSSCSKWVKIEVKNMKCLCLTVHTNSLHQVVYVYCRDAEVSVKIIEKLARKIGFEV